MAIWYTDNITGNDTTGDGSISTPFKTVNKAVSVASSADEIRVAGSGWTLLSGTFSVATASTTVLNTTVSQVGQLTAGASLISIKDPLLGDRKLLYKVTAVTSTSITVHTAIGLTPGLNYEVEKITTNYYSSGTASTQFENLTAVGPTLTDLKIEGGWTSGFTAQDGVTAMIYTVTSTTSTSGNGFTLGTGQTGWSFNNFAFASLSQGVGTTTSGATMPIGLGSIWLQNCRIFSNNFSNYPINISGLSTKLYVTTTSAQVLVGSNNNDIQFTIDDLYVIDASSTSYGLNLSNSGQCTVNNMWVRSSSTSHIGTPSGGQLYNGNWIVNNLTVAWLQDTTLQAYCLFGTGAAGKLISLTNLGTLEDKSFQLGNFGSQAQWINTSINVDNYTVLGSTLSNTGVGSWSSAFVKDIEGDKLLNSFCIPTFADPTQFDTGTNSLRIKKNGGVYSAPIPIKQYYIPAGSTDALTFTIRAKSTDNNSTSFAFLPAPGSPYTAINFSPYVLEQTFLITNAWADYTYTLAAPDVVDMAGNWVTFVCVSKNSWSENHVWIDSVTIS